MAFPRISLLLALLGSALSIQAQTPDLSSEPRLRALDDIGVNLRSGKVTRTMGLLAIGPAGAPRLSYGIFNTTLMSAGGTVVHGTLAESCITPSGYPLCTYLARHYNLGGDSETYLMSPPSATAAPGFTEQGSLVTGTYALTRKDGSVWQFDPNVLGPNIIGSLSSVTYPDGEVHTYHYSNGELRSIVSTTGYMLHLEGNGTLAAATVHTPEKVTLINLNTDYCAPLAATCTGLTLTWPSMTYTGWGTSTVTATDTLGRARTRFKPQEGRLRYTTPEGVWFEFFMEIFPPYAAPGGSVFCDERRILRWLNTPAGQWNYNLTQTSPCFGPTITGGVSTGPDGKTQKWEAGGFWDGLNRKTSYALGTFNHFTGSGETGLNAVVWPEGNRLDYSRDARQNAYQSVATPKTGSTAPTLSASASFPASCTAATAKVCNQPDFMIDPRGFRTDYTYSATHGGVLTETLPADANGVRPQMRYTYQQLSAQYKNSAGQLVAGPPIWKLVSVSLCKSTASCTGGADEVVTTYGYNSNLLPTTTTVSTGTGSVLSVVTTTYDPIGNVTAIDGPAAGSDDTVHYFYNSEREQIGQISPDPDGAGSLPRTATRTTYNLDGQPRKIELGNATGTTLASLNAMTVHRYVDITYDSSGRKLRETTVGSGVTHGVTQYSYDVRNRPVCTAIRMNPAAFGSLPADACTLGTSGAFGPDRITRNVYDDAGQLTIVQRAYGTSLQQNYATYTYSDNGKRLSVTDAKGNRSALTHDGLDRQTHLYFPSKTTPGQTSATDYEQYLYDANGNRTSLRKRDGRIISYGYDALNRMTLKNIPDTSSGDVYFGYDLRGLQTSARFGSSSGLGIVNVFDSLGRLSSSTNNLNGSNRVLSYLYDAHGNRTQLTFPDGNYFVYSYDGLDRMTAILENGGATVASLAYDSQGRRSGLTGAVTSSYGYDSASRLASITHDLAGTAQDLNYGFSQYNPANQIITRSLSNDGYAWTGAANLTRSYGINGLNQYTAAGTLSLSYDANGNLTSDGGVTLEYDVENRLISASGAKTAALAYDPLGRLHQTSGGAFGTTQFLYDGDALVAEYDGSGILQRRYVHGPGVDEPLLWYETAGVSSATRRALRADHEGTVVAIADSTGASLAINRFDEYGIAAATNSGRFAYTGQIVIPELGMYHYKARIYHPALGRFLQTDPIGYEDDVNLYAYAYNDPLNRIDPQGTCSWGALGVAGATSVADGPIPVGEAIGIGILAGDCVYRAARMAVAGVTALGAAMAVKDFVHTNYVRPAADTRGTPPDPEDPFDWKKGPQSTASISVWHAGKNAPRAIRGARVDVENPNAAQRPGQIHLQVGGNKYIYRGGGRWQPVGDKTQKLTPDQLDALNQQTDLAKKLRKWEEILQRGQGATDSGGFDTGGN